MSTTTRIIQIGNSRGIRVPKAVLEQAELPEEVELRAEPGRLVVTAARKTRAGWAEIAKEMHALEHDQLLDDFQPNDFDDQGWEW